jgi:hypothetical protein
MNLKHLFTEHPISVGETYLGHLRSASTFGFSMLVGGAACLIHAALPFLCVRTGSNCVADLHSRMMARRVESRDAEHDENRGA